MNVGHQQKRAMARDAYTTGKSAKIMASTLVILLYATMAACCSGKVLLCLVAQVQLAGHSSPDMSICVKRYMP